jgi:type 1 glutamine amidotransferase
MKRLIGLLAVVIVASSWLRGASANDEGAPIRVLLTYGGHGFEEAPFFAMFDALPNVEYTKAQLPQQADLLKPSLRDDYDAIVMYDMVGGISPQQQKAFLALLERGIGVVSLHHNLGAHRDWAGFRQIIGGKFIFGEVALEGKTYQPSTWSHGEDMRVKVVDRDHPITKGLDDFEIHDETYGGYYTASGVHVLLETDHPKNDPELAWTKTHGKSRVFYLMLGHDHLAWENPAYPKLLARGIHWVARR